MEARGGAVEQQKETGRRDISARRHSTVPSSHIVLYLCFVTCLQYKCKHYNEANNTRTENIHMCFIVVVIVITLENLDDALTMISFTLLITHHFSMHSSC